MVLVLFEPLDERDGSLRGQLVAGSVVRELWERARERIDWQGGVGTRGRWEEREEISEHYYYNVLQYMYILGSQLLTST